LTVTSVGDYAIFFQEWVLVDPTTAEYQVTDLLTVPEGYACEEYYTGRYLWTTVEGGCDSRVCAISDPCPSRASLWNNVATGAFDGDECAVSWEDTVVEWPNNGCSRGNTWTASAGECIEQFGGGRCIYCHGVANGLDVKTCIDMNGGKCNDIFRSIPAEAWCNLEFECQDPASTLSLSVIAVFSVLLAFLH
jgi:hypothetical protein